MAENIEIRNGAAEQTAPAPDFGSIVELFQKSAQKDLPTSIESSEHKIDAAEAAALKKAAHSLASDFMKNANEVAHDPEKAKEHFGFILAGMNVPIEDGSGDYLNASIRMQVGSVTRPFVPHGLDENELKDTVIAPILEKTLSSGKYQPSEELTLKLFPNDEVSPYAEIRGEADLNVFRVHYPN